MADNGQNQTENENHEDDDDLGACGCGEKVWWEGVVGRSDEEEGGDVEG